MESFTRPVPVKCLSIFRILFGLILTYQFYKISIRIGYFKDPNYLYFPYPELDWVPLFDYPVLISILGLGALTSIAVTLGALFRVSIILSSLAYFYLFSLDAVYFNNHYYLILLFSILLSFTNADYKYSFSRIKKSFVPNWQYLIFQFMIAIVFFYGGLSKLSKDWLSGQVLEDIHSSESVTKFLVYSGTFFDLLIPFFLFFGRTRFIAIILVLAFNISNHFLFDDIDSFPFLMIASLILFMNIKAFPKSILNWAELNLVNKQTQFQQLPKCKSILLLIFFTFQIFFPLRHYFIHNNSEWTGQGHYFSWRMKSYKKHVDLKVFAFDKASNRRAYPINHGMSNYETQRTCAMPHMIPVLAASLKSKINAMDGFNPNLGISVDYIVELNGHPAKLAIDPNIDISKVQFNRYTKNHWILDR